MSDDEETKSIKDVVIKPNATKHTRKYGEHKPVGLKLVENEIKSIYVDEILGTRKNSEFPVKPGQGLNGADRLTTNSCTTANIHDSERFRESDSDLIEGHAELCHYLRHNDEKQYNLRKKAEDLLPKIKIKVEEETKE